MKTLIKLLMWLVLAVVVVVGAAIVLIPMLVDPNDYKAEIADATKAQTGRELKIEGDLKMTVFPVLGVEVGPLSLSNAEGFSAPVFLKSERTQVRVNVMPLLTEQRIEADTIEIHGLHVNLEQNKSGATNWDDLTKGSGKASGDAGSSSSDAPAVAGFALGGLNVKGAQITWKQPGQQVTLTNVDLQTGAVELGKPIEVSGGLDVALTNPAAKGRLDVATTISLNGEDVKADGLTLSVSLTGTTIGTVEAKLAAAVARQGNKVSADGLKLTANLSGDHIPGGKLDAELAAGVDANLANKSLQVTGLSLRANEFRVDGGVSVSKFDSDALALTGKLNVAQFNLRKLMEALGQPVPVTADANVLTAVAVQADLKGSRNAVSLAPLSVKLDESNVTGSFSVSDVSRGALRFDLTMDQIDADRYLPPKAEGKAASPGVAAAGASSDIHLDPVRALDLNGKVKLGKLKVTGLSMSDVSAAIKAKGGNVALAPLSAKLYGGSYNGNIGFDARGKSAKLSLNEVLKNIQISPLLKDLQGEDRLEGTAEAQLKATTTGNNPEAMKAALNGSGRFKFRNGALKGVNIAAMIRDAKAKILGGGGADANAPQRTDFSVMGGTFKIKNGVVNNRDFAAKSPLLRITGKGTADLPKELINYRVTTSVVASAKGQGGQELADLAGIDIPLKVTGTFAKPEYGLDEEALVKALATGKAKDLLGKGTKGIKAAVGDKVQGAVGGKLKDALGGGAIGGLTKQLGGGAAQPAAPADATKDPAAAVGKALKGIFGN